MFGFLEITKSSLGLLMMLKERYMAESGQKTRQSNQSHLLRLMATHGSVGML